MNLNKTYLKVLFGIGYAMATTWIFPAHAQETNLVRNGDFTQITDGKAANWKFHAGGKDDAAAFPIEEGKGHIGQVTAISGSGISYLSQNIRLEPHQKYRLTAQAKLSGGKLSFAIGAVGLNRRITSTTEDSPMVPWFWDESWLSDIHFTPGEWRTVTIEFDSGEVKNVLLTLGGYYSTKGTFSFDDVSIIKISD